jgi:hypothetical protein
MLDCHLDKMLVQEAMGSVISLQGFKRQIVCTELVRVHVFLECSHSGFSRLLNMTNLRLFLSLIRRLLAISTRITESSSSHCVIFLEERTAHWKPSLILRGMFPNSFQPSIILPLPWFADLMSRGVFLFQCIHVIPYPFTLIAVPPNVKKVSAIRRHTVSDTLDLL